MKKTLNIVLLVFISFVFGCSSKPLAVLKEEPIEIDMLYLDDYDPYTAFTDIQEDVDIGYELDEEDQAHLKAVLGDE